MLQELHALHSHLKSMENHNLSVHLNDIHWEENIWPSIDALIKSAKPLVTLLNVDSQSLTRTSMVVMVMMGLSGGFSSVLPLFSIYSIAWDDYDDDNLAHVSSPPFIQSMLHSCWDRFFR